MKNVLITDKQKLSNQKIYKYKFVISWNDNLNKNNVINLNQFIEDNQIFIKDSYINWIESIPYKNYQNGLILDKLQINEHFNFWWSTHIAQRDNSDISTYINDIIKVIAIDLWIKKNNIEEITLIINSEKLLFSLRQIGSSNDLIINESNLQKIRNTLINKFSNCSYLPKIFNSFLISFFWFIFYFISHYPLRNAGLGNLKNKNIDVIFLSYLFNLDNNLLERNQYKSNYWVDINKIISDLRLNTAKVHLFIPSRQIQNAYSARKFINIFNNEKKNINHLSLDSNINFKLFLKVLFIWLNIIRKFNLINGYFKKQKLFKIDFSWYFKDDLIKSFFGKNAIFSIYSYYQLRNLFALKEFKKNTPVFYLFENKAFEYSLLSVLKEKKLNPIAICHTPIAYWDLRFFNFKKIYNLNSKRPFPSKLAVNNKRNLYDLNDCANEIVKIEAQRYSYLSTSSKKINFKDSKYDFEQKKQVKFLILGESNENYLNFHINLLRRNIFLVKNFQLFYKPHPINQKKISLGINVGFEILNEKLSKIITNFDLIYAPSSSSSVLDAYCSGLPLISSVMPGSLNFSPLKNNNEISFVRSNEEFKIAIENFFKKSNLKENQYFFLNEEYKLWLDLVKSNLNI